MDGKVVSREIRREVWPLLRSSGFTRFTSRTAWRESGDRIDVVNFQSFNSYLAESVGCTTFSFALNLGCCLAYIPLSFSGGKKRRQFPAEYECHFRYHLSKSIKQPELPRLNIWLIKERGAYLAESIADAKAVLQRDGIPWFERFAQREIVLAGLLNDETFWESGTRTSPQRNYLAGYVALATNERAIAAAHLLSALQSGCFKRDENELRTEIEKLGKPDSLL